MRKNLKVFLGLLLILLTASFCSSKKSRNNAVLLLLLLLAGGGSSSSNNSGGKGKGTTATYSKDSFANQSVTVTITGATLKTDAAATIVSGKEIQVAEVTNGSVSIFTRVSSDGKTASVGFNGEELSRIVANASFSISFPAASFTNNASASTTAIKVKNTSPLTLKKLAGVKDIGSSVKPATLPGAFTAASVATTTANVVGVTAVVLLFVHKYQLLLTLAL